MRRSPAIPDLEQGEGQDKGVEKSEVVARVKMC
jgi:hypothetical protein